MSRGCIIVAPKNEQQLYRRMPHFFETSSKCFFRSQERLIPILVSLDVDDLHDLREDHVNKHEDRKPEHVA